MRYRRPRNQGRAVLISRAESIQLILSQHPVSSTDQTASYSNVAFQLLALAYEAITCETLEKAFYHHVARPLDLSRSFWDAPPANDSNELRLPLGPGVEAEWNLGIQNA